VTWKEDALHNALVKVLGVVNGIPEVHTLKSSDDLAIMARTLDEARHRSIPKGAYDPQQWHDLIMRVLQDEVQHATDELALPLRDLWALPEEMAAEASGAICRTIIHIRASHTGVYDFSSPFYAYAGRIARNELVSLFRRTRREPDPLPLDDQVGRPAPEPSHGEDGVQGGEARLLRLRIDLARLLALVQPEHPLNWHQVALQTMAARPQFWLALAATGLAPPSGISPPAAALEDQQIAGFLCMTVNNLRVQRAYARRRVGESDPMLGWFLERLMAKPTQAQEQATQAASDDLMASTGRRILDEENSDGRA
jgi:hypothetical protein